MATNFDDKLFDDSTTYKEAPTYDDSLFEDAPEDDSFLPSMQELKAGAAGAAESFTSGFAPEIAGGAQALVGVLPEALGGDRYSDLLSDYKKYSAEREKDFRALEKENPSAYLTGEIAGGVGQGIATGIATGGLGTAAALASGGSKLSMAMNAAKLAGIGAGSGALTGAGYSKESILDAASGDSEAQLGLTKDIGTGATLGAAGNVAAPIVGKALGKGLEVGGKAIGGAFDFAANKIDTVADLQKAYKLAKQGISVTGEKAKKIIHEEARDIADQIVQGFDSQKQSGSDFIGEVLKKSKPSQDISAVLKEAESIIQNNPGISNENKSRLLAVINNNKVRTVTETVESGKDLSKKALEKTMRIEEASAPMLGEKVSFPDIKETDDALIALRKKVNQEGVEDVSTLKQEMLPDRITTKTVDELKDMDLQGLYDYRKALTSEYSNMNMDYGGRKFIEAEKNRVDDVVKSTVSEEDFTKFTEGKELFKDVKLAGENYRIDKDAPLSKRAIDVKSTLLKDENAKGMENLEESLKFAREEYVPQSLREEARTLSTRMDLNKIGSGQALTSGSPLGLIAGSVGASSVRAGEALGTSRNIISKIAKTPKEFTRDILNSSEDQLYKLAAKMPTEFAESIINALKDTTKKDRLLWALSGQPAFREAANRVEQSEIELPPLDVNIDN